MIYIVLPVFNEEENVARVVGEIHGVLKNKPHTIVAVNDGSRDGSLDILKKLQKSENDSRNSNSFNSGNRKHTNTGNLIVESYLTNMNVGAVFSTGISRVLKDAKPEDILIIMESDGTSAVDRIPLLVEQIEKNTMDISIASRYQPGGAYRNFPFLRRVFSYCASALMKQYFPIPGVSDYTIFFRAYKIRIIKKAVDHFGMFGLIQSLGFVANAELLIKLSFFTDKISEIPFVYDYGKKKGASKIGIFRTINEYFTVLTYLTGVKKKLSK